MKQQAPILVTEFEIFILQIFLYPIKAKLQITFVPSFMLYSFIFTPFNRRFPSLLYFAPNSSSTAFARSSSVTSVESISIFSGFCGFLTANRRKETCESDLCMSAMVKRLTRVLMSTSCEGKTFFNKVHEERSR